MTGIDALKIGEAVVLLGGGRKTLDDQIDPAVGILLGARIPTNWPLSFMLPLTFIALVVPALKGRSMIAAAVTAGIAGFLTTAFPLKTGLLVAALAGIVVGMIVEGKTR